ncbi:MAG: ISAs1 family transposase [Xenococcaceae cyanobacterium MO_207.B15]|nr:ISAs1 family transposase [Xenococcaceae cyanobacterium MO_207.B15]
MSKNAKVFNDWASQMTSRQNGQWIALDGKSLKNTVSDCHGKQQNFVMMVSAFSHQRAEILGLKVMENKNQSEINVVRELIELLDLSGVIFTLGRFTLSKKTISAIIESSNDYLVVVKKNQKTLYQQINSHTNSISPTLEFQQTETTLR